MTRLKIFFISLVLALVTAILIPDTTQAQWNFIRGDANGNGGLDPDDFTAIFEIIVRDSVPGCADAADVNDDGHVTPEDLDYLGNYIFQDSAPPPPPFPNCGCDPTPDTLTCTFTKCAMSTFTRGDVDCNGVVDSQDSIFLDNFLLGGTAPACLDAADVNDDAVVNSADLTYLADYLSLVGPPPPSPFPAPCIDPTCDTLSCDSTCYPLECSDGIDNDGDGLVDYLADCGCSQPCDEFEAPNPVTQCNDGIDNDGDGFVDLADCGCVNTCDTLEQAASAQCDDGIDNDGDGLIDYPTDCGCTSDCDGSEGTNPTTVCNDGLDNDGDGLIDLAADCGCENRCDSTETPNPTRECNDGIDNDGDGLVDLADTNCTNLCDRLEAFCLTLAGDVNGDQKYSLPDIITLVNIVFKGAPQPDPVCRGDANNNNLLSLADIIYLVNHIFKGGPKPLDDSDGICCQN